MSGLDESCGPKCQGLFCTHGAAQLERGVHELDDALRARVEAARQAAYLQRILAAVRDALDVPVDNDADLATLVRGLVLEVRGLKAANEALRSSICGRDASFDEAIAAAIEARKEVDVRCLPILEAAWRRGYDFARATARCPETRGDLRCTWSRGHKGAHLAFDSDDGCAPVTWGEEPRS